MKPFRRLDRYVLALMAGPVAGSLAVTLTAILLQRLLELFNQFAANGVKLGFILDLTVQMTPIYLSLALPASFFFSTFVVVSKLNDGSEIDAMLASGVSISRLAAPFAGAGLVLGLVSLVLFGFLQPYGRYGYQVVLNAAIHAGWTAQVQPQEFTGPSGGVTLTADRVGPSGRRLHGLFMRRIGADGGEQIVTAKTGLLKMSPDGRRVEVTLDEGSVMEQAVGKAPSLVRFHNIALVEPLGEPGGGVKPRGGDVRELTLFELSHLMRTPDPIIPRGALAAEFYSRLARSFAVPLLPLLALPMAMAAKRRRRAPGLILAAVLMMSFHHGVQLAQSLAASGRADPLMAVGGVFAVFAGICLWLFLSSLGRPGDTPVGRAIATLDSWIQGLRDFLGVGGAAPVSRTG